MPLWIGAGLADWYLHRRTRIEDTAGPRESALHSLMFAETGVPVLLGLFCEVNAGVLATAAGAVAAHSATAYWDQAYAEPRRRVTAHPGRPAGLDAGLVPAQLARLARALTPGQEDYADCNTLSTTPTSGNAEEGHITQPSA